MLRNYYCSGKRPRSRRLSPVCRRFVLSLVLTCFTNTSYGIFSHSPGFTHLKVENGLPHNSVYDIIQDSRGFMWFATLDGLARYDGSQFKVYRYDIDGPDTGLHTSNIVSLCEDHTGNIWVGTIDGVYVYDPLSERFEKFVHATAAGSRVEGKIVSMEKDKEDKIWIASYGKGVFCYDAGSGRLDLYGYTGQAGSLSSDQVMDIYVDPDGSVWVGVIGPLRSGVNLFDQHSGTFSYFPISSTQPNLGVSTLTGDGKGMLFMGSPNSGVTVMDRSDMKAERYLNDRRNAMFVNDILVAGDEVMVGTNSGIYIKDRRTGGLKHWQQDFADHRSLSSCNISCFEQDRDGGIWIGTMSGGVNYLPGNYSVFDKFYPTSGINQISGREVRDICEDSRGNLWIATGQSGLNRFDPRTGHFEHYTAENGKIKYNQITALMIDGNRLWIGYYGEGAEILDINTGHRRQVVGNPSPIDNSVFSIYRDRRGTVWLGTTQRLARYDEKSGTLGIVDQIPFDTFIYDILEDSRGTIWFASNGCGVFRFNPVKGEWKRFHRGVEQKDSLCYDYCIGLSEDSQGRVWICTEGGGVSCFDPHTDTFSNLTKKDGLPSNIVYKVVDDGSGRLWLSTSGGLCCMDIKTGGLTTYTYSNGLLNDQFNYKSGLRASDGSVYFGSTEGFVRFDPDDIHRNENIPPVVLTDFRVFGENIVTGGNSPLKSSIVSAKDITLPHDESTVTFGFAVLSYNAPELNRYEYMLEGYDSDWTYANNIKSAGYANLPPGRYVFTVRGANSDGVWNEAGATVILTIKPPWWGTLAAKVIYILASISIIFSMLKMYSIRMKRRQERAMDELNRAREKALYDAKMNFFTTVSHEVKTPLSLIKAPYEQIVKCGTRSKNYDDNIETMGSNIERLTNLVGQLLDFTKIENDNFLSTFTMTDIGSVVSGVAHRFGAILRQSDIALNLSLPDTPVLCYADSEAITKIASNLMHNACKFADRAIEVLLSVKEDRFVLSVINDGQGIPADQRDKIFESFYQLPKSNAKGGVGLGLSIVKHLAGLHSGNVYVETTARGMTCFRVEIPLMLHEPEIHPSDMDRVKDTPDRDGKGPKQVQIRPNRTAILVVEDNRQMQRFLEKLLSDTYNVYLADNGLQALNLLDENHVGIILSDVLMPEMDGFQLCQRIKTTLRYSHIPVVLLTAKSNVSSKIEGMEAGADAYIEKPFSTDFLLAQIANVLNNKKILKDAFLNSPYTLTDSIAGSAADEKFLEQVNGIIMENLGDSGFSVEQLAREIKMSRTTLDRKIKGVAYITTNDFIKLVRIKQAAKMLAEHDYRINEVCYITGFTSPSYFSKCFREQFGISPKDVTKKKRQ